ncbi:putative protein N(5)-glutamine methyltransferase [Sinomonas notoginsengisoli]
MFAEEEAALLLDAAPDAPELERLVRLRVAGEPLEHLLGWAEFAGLRIAVGPGVFVPRRRSELLVRLALERLEHRAYDPGRPVAVLDLCCGSGALGAGVAAGLTLAGWLPREFELHAADLDPVAAGFARRNLAPFGGHVSIGDLFAPLPAGLRGRADVILANAPYVPSGAVPLMPPEARDHEPLTALDGGADGLGLHRRIAAATGEWLAPGGALIIEVSRGQVGAALGFLGAVGHRGTVEEDEDLDALAIVAA